MKRVRLKPCNDYMKLCDEIKWKLGTPEKKDEQKKPRIFQ